MLILQKGICQKCGSKFGLMDTVQSTNVECSKCKKRVTVCETCKDEGCDCGGELLDAWDKNPGFMF